MRPILEWEPARKTSPEAFRARAARPSRAGPDEEPLSQVARPLSSVRPRRTGSEALKQIVTFILLFAVLCNGAGADGLSVGIKLVEQKIYFLNDDIEIKITVKNDAVDMRQFRIADNRVFSLDFDVRTASNRPSDYHSVRFQNNRNTLKPVFYRDVSLSPGEEYSLTVSLSDYIALKDAGLYYVQAVFFPDLYMADAAPSLTSNKLTLNIRPAVQSPAERVEVEARVERARQRDTLPPDEVVTYMLKARMADEWAKFFLYINLEDLYLNRYLTTRQNRDQFNRLSEAAKHLRVNGYKKQIMAGKDEWQLVLLPHTFEIVETRYTPFAATVKARQIYQHPDYKEPRLYTYTLKRSGNVWEITDYLVANINTVNK